MNFAPLFSVVAKWLLADDAPRYGNERHRRRPLGTPSMIDGRHRHYGGRMSPSLARLEKSPTTAANSFA